MMLDDIICPAADISFAQAFILFKLCFKVHDKNVEINVKNS